MTQKREIAMVVKKGLIKDLEDDDSDLEYWLSKTPLERIRQVTSLVLASIKTGTKMDRTHIVYRKMKEDGTC
jgi:hypothetical protein